MRFDTRPHGLKKAAVLAILTACTICFSFSFKTDNTYKGQYTHLVTDFEQEQQVLLNKIRGADLKTGELASLITEIKVARNKLKAIDFWLRYLEPIVYKKINGPLPVEWETEVFEKFEKPYKREGAGLTLAEIYLGEQEIHKDSLARLIQGSLEAMNTFKADSITRELNTPDHFFFANRLFLLNLSAIYTTGFECPDKNSVIPELRSMLSSVLKIYDAYNQSFSSARLPLAYLDQYDKMISFVSRQPDDYEVFDHFLFIRDYVNPLFGMNQKLITAYSVVSRNLNDYALNDTCHSIFDKSLYNAQNTKGIFSLIEDQTALDKIRATGKLLFYDPILSGNNKRSCASCHKPTEYFTDTVSQTSLEFDERQPLQRNTPSLIDVTFNHLLMLDGKHTSLQDQAKDVILNSREMNSTEKELLKKVLGCREYKDAFKSLLKLTPEEKEITLGHIVSSLTFYYAGFSNFYSPFDNAMNNSDSIGEAQRKGFNIFMGKAQCSTCHFVPNFNGVKPPYVGSEFEVLGVPGDTAFEKLSADSGRYCINAASEMFHAFRTGSIRNAQYTRPYMHNGIFNNLDQVIDFYDAGGGTGKKLIVDNQTLAGDSLKLSKEEKRDLIAFIQSLNEKIIFENPPERLPVSGEKYLNSRKVGGEY